MGMCIELEPKPAYDLLVLVESQLPRILARIGSGVEQLFAQLQYTMQLISTAQRQVSVGENIDMDRLRLSFSVSMSQHVHCQAKSIMLPIVYYTCSLWAGLMMSLNRCEEAVALLASIYDDMVQFTQRHPYCMLTRQLQASVCHNLVLVYTEAGDPVRVGIWASRLQSLVAIPHLHIPPEVARSVGDPFPVSRSDYSIG
jgi:hypothetical protein